MKYRRSRRASFVLSLTAPLSLALALLGKPASAACLGLGAPAPQNINVCETLVEQLIIPDHWEEQRTCVVSGLQCFAQPHCCAPGMCLLLPDCHVTQQVLVAAGYVLNAGDLYCDFREVDPEELIEKVRDGVYASMAPLTSGGISSTLFNVAAAHIDTMECAGEPLNDTLKNVLWELAAASGEAAFSSTDLDRVRIVPRSTSLGSLYLREGFGAITLDSVVIIRDDEYAALRAWSRPWSEVRRGSQLVDRRAMLLMFHEMVHVRQYRNVTRERFVNQYLVEALSEGYESISTEVEAYEAAERASDAYREILGEEVALLLNVL